MYDYLVRMDLTDHLTEICQPSSDAFEYLIEKSVPKSQAMLFLLQKSSISGVSCIPPITETARLPRGLISKEAPIGISLSGSPTTTIVPSKTSKSKYWFQSISTESVDQKIKIPFELLESCSHLRVYTLDSPRPNYYYNLSDIEFPSVCVLLKIKNKKKMLEFSSPLRTISIRLAHSNRL
jgi:hypothetical protein